MWRTEPSMRRRFVRFALLVVVMTGAPAARADTTCTFGGPSPGAQILRIELPQGSDYVSIAFSSQRATVVAGDRTSWHLAQGIGLLDTDGSLRAWRVSSQGTSPRRAVVEANGTSVARPDYPGPDAPFAHSNSGDVSNLEPGVYHVIAFGTDGTSDLPNAWWGGELRLSADASCVPVGAGDIIDKDHTDFTGGTHAFVYGAGVARDLSLVVQTERKLVFGLMDATTQIAGEAVLTYDLPGLAQGSLRNAIAPFVSQGGALRFSAEYAGPFPIVAISGVAFDLT